MPERALRSMMERRASMPPAARRSVMWQRIIVAVPGAGPAEGAAVPEDLAAEVDALAAGGAEDARAFKAGQVLGKDADIDPLDGEELFGRQDAVGFHLLEGGFFEVREELGGAVFAGFESGDADGFSGFEITKSGRHFAVIEEFKGAFSETAAGDDADGVGGAAVDFDEGDEAFAVNASGIVEAEQGEAVQGHADAEDLAGAEMAVGLAGEFFVFGESEQQGGTLL
jgi:hypothetical protein